MKTALTLFMMVCGNVFMTTAWYWHLRHGSTGGKALPLIILTSWLIAFFEYCIMVPANRIGMFSAGFTVAQPTIISVSGSSRAVRVRCESRGFTETSLVGVVFRGDGPHGCDAPGSARLVNPGRPARRYGLSVPTIQTTLLQNMKKQVFAGVAANGLYPASGGIRRILYTC